MTKEQHSLHINHISKIYEESKKGVYAADMKAVLNGLQELRNICCDFARQLLDKKK